jgi:hypothetical protein
MAERRVKPHLDRVIRSLDQLLDVVEQLWDRLPSLLAYFLACGDQVD